MTQGNNQILFLDGEGQDLLHAVMKLKYVYNFVTLHNQPVKVVLYNGILHALHCDFEQICVGGICEMYVDFTAGCAIETSELCHEIFGSGFVIVVSTGVVGEEIAYGLLH